MVSGDGALDRPLLSRACMRSVPYRPQYSTELRVSHGGVRRGSAEERHASYSVIIKHTCVCGSKSRLSCLQFVRPSHTPPRVHTTFATIPWLVTTTLAHTVRIVSGVGWDTPSMSAGTILASQRVSCNSIIIRGEDKPERKPEE